MNSIIVVCALLAVASAQTPCDIANQFSTRIQQVYFTEDAPIKSSEAQYYLDYPGQVCTNEFTKN